MASDAEREVMGLLLTTNAEMVSGVLRGIAGSEAPAVLAAVAATRSLDLIVDDVIHALVRQARGDGHTWAEIGQVLHVTRQAAFQRFGASSADGRDGSDATVPAVGAADKAMAVLDHWVNGRWREVRGGFDQRMTQMLSVAMLESARLKTETGFGRFLEYGAPRVTVRGPHTVVDVPMAFETSDLKGRVVFDAEARVAGFFVLPTDAA